MINKHIYNLIDLINNLLILYIDLILDFIYFLQFKY